MKVRMTGAKVILAALAAVGVLMTMSVPAYAVTYRNVYTFDTSTGTFWFLSNCANSQGTCTLTTNSNYYAEFSFQNSFSYGGATYYQMVDRNTGECVTAASAVGSGVYSDTCNSNLANDYWHYNGTSETSENLALVESGESSNSCLSANAAHPGDDTYVGRCTGWNTEWSQPAVG